MTISSIVFAAIAAFSINAGQAAQAEDAVAPALNNGKIGTTTPQVAYPPICGYDPLFPRYCRRW